jgi:hypothetical protein
MFLSQMVYILEWFTIDQAVQIWILTKLLLDLFRGLPTLLTWIAAQVFGNQIIPPL